VYLKATDH